MSVDQSELPLLEPKPKPVEENIPLRKTPWQRLWEDRLARIALILLGVLYLAAALADPLSPYSMHYSDPELGNAPPTEVYWNDEKGNLVNPYVYRMERTFDPMTLKQTYSEVRDKKYELKMFYPGEDYHVFGIIPGNIHLFGVDSPAHIFILGTDISGRDNWSRLFFGAQKSLTIGFLGLFIAFPIGIAYGGLSGFLGGLVDNWMMRIAEAVMSIPSFYLLIGLAAILPPKMTSSERFALITVILSFIGWAGLARIIRGMVLSIRNEEFVEAARAAGMPEFWNMLKHVIPQTASFLIISATLQVPSFILSESGLSFLGLGIQQPDASWGNMLKEAQDNVNDLLDRPWLITPGIAIFITILCFNTVGDVLRDVLDPKLHGSK
ncbi:MAG: ABC transporter permease [Candidatus Obscuribacterales bacterium]